MPEQDLIPIVAISCAVGGPMLWGIIYSVATQIRLARTAEHNAALAREMVSQGHSPDDIIRVLKAASADAETHADAMIKIMEAKARLKDPAGGCGRR